MMKDQKVIIHWFRKDLRLHDNPSLYHAAKEGQLLPIFIFDTHYPKQYQIGSGSKWFLHQSLLALQESLNGNLCLFSGNPKDILEDLMKKHKINTVSWNKCYEPWQISRDKEMEELIKSNGVDVNTYNGALIWNPEDIHKQDQTPYKVFTPYFTRGCLQNGPKPKKPLEVPPEMDFFLDENLDNSIENLNLVTNPDWGKKLTKYWKCGEANAIAKFEEFIENGLKSYQQGRDFPWKQSVSKLSPHLTFGEISPNYIWDKVKALKTNKENNDAFLRQLAWREFSYYLLFHFPTITDQNLQTKFDNFKWKHDDKQLKAWQDGKTGYPIVDAGMRQLKEEGYMHNRIRMVVASFLVKNLLMHWKNGENLFWDLLVDADLASNNSSWQWVAGCGVDAAPYFRVFNPTTQGTKWDKEGKYTRKYCPELKDLEDKWLYCPWDAPKKVLKDAGVTLGTDYPFPVVDLNASRDLALETFKKLKPVDK